MLDRPLVSPTPMPGTYAAAIEYLSRDVVESIERSLPCPRAADGRHIWDEATTWNRSGHVRTDWWCVYCGLASMVDPLSISQRPYPQIRSASETYGALLDGTLWP